jgi:4-amino-4-deoxy-L-arabinose transferase-like glycosyltransferase
MKFENNQKFWLHDTSLLVYVGIATIVVHLLTGNRYGFNRDELAVLEDARHLAWGYVAYPPMTPFFGRVALELFGTSLVGFRFFAAVVQAIAVVLTGLMAKELGGKRLAQLIAAGAAVPFCLGGGSIMQYISFDYLCWVLAAYFLVKLLRTQDARWWVVIGAAIGLGLLSKYTMLFFAAGIAGGLLLTPARSYVRSGWLWLGKAVALAIFLPNLLWQARHNFVALRFLQFIHTRDVREGLTAGFLPDQLKLMLLAFPLAAGGLYFYFFTERGRSFRLVGWTYLITLLLFVIMMGRGYYLAPAYPMLYAAGAVWAEEWLGSIEKERARWVKAAVATALVFDIGVGAAFALPLAPVNSAWWKFAIRVDSALREEIGWPEFVERVARIRDALPVQEHSRLGIMAGNYGEVGALNLYGTNYGLPRAISGVNSSWERGYGAPPETLIVVGFPKKFVEEHFAGCRLVGHTGNNDGVQNEETLEHPDIFVCGPPILGWPEFWRDFQFYA